ncbi:MAG: S49 family peptidase [Candidatus Competibacteraceae bacterium]|nr:S49 family peptidase [Candidatus Competibacteraceae bacterium]
MSDRETGVSDTPSAGSDPWTQNPPVGSGKNSGDDEWARGIVLKLATAALKEQRRARRWGIFFKVITLAYVGVLLWTVLDALELQPFSTTQRELHTAVVNIEGTISSNNEASAINIIGGLRAAMEAEDSAGVILHINSPGGSPVQSGQVYDEIMRLREQYPDKPIYAVASDTCASGAYYIAAAAQEIYADKASLIGSIGVVAASFGFVDAMEKLGVERRLFTAGENKALLDPFSPQRPAETEFFQGLLNEVHQQFIDAVKQGRGDRLVDDPSVFSGLVWSGEKSIELGLVDGLGSVREVAEQLIGAEKLMDYTARENVIDRLLTQMGYGIGTALQQSLGLERPLLH